MINLTYDKFFQVLLILQTISYIADYPLQGDFLANMKAKYKYLLFVHCFIWTGCICAGLMYFGAFAWWKVAVLLIGHYVCDMVKIIMNKHEPKKSLTANLWTNQVYHLCQIVVVIVIP